MSSPLKKLRRLVFGASEQEDERNRQAKIDSYLVDLEAYKSQGDAGIESLIGLLKVDSVVVGDRVSEALADRGAAALPALRDYLYKQIAETRTRKRRNIARLCLWLILWLSICAVAFSFPQKSFGHILLRIVGQLVASFSGLFILKDAASARQNAISALRRLDDPRQIGLFAACMNDKNGDVRKIARDTLKKLMPKAQASDAQYINKDEMQALADALRKQKQDAGLMLALLKGLEQIGDERALANVAALTEDSSVSPSIKQAARDCLPYLQIRAEQAKQAQTLLRASYGNEIAPETLLRPASGVSASSNDAQELLRPQM